MIISDQKKVKVSGIHFVEGNNKQTYRVILCHNGFSHHIGNYDSLEEAIIHRDASYILYKNEKEWKNKLIYPELENLYRIFICPKIKIKYDNKIAGRYKDRSKKAKKMIKEKYLQEKQPKKYDIIQNDDEDSKLVAKALLMLSKS